MPVLLSTMPFGAPLAEMLWKVRSSAWIVVLATLSAVPVVVVSVLFGAVAPLVSVMARLPLTADTNAGLAPVVALMPPSKRTRPVPFVDRLMPCEVSVTRPLMSTVPPSRLVTSTDRAAAPEVVSVAPIVTLPAVVVDVEGAGGGGDRAAVDGERAGPADVGEQDAVGGAAPLLLTVLKVTPAAPMVTPLRLMPVPVKLVIWLAALVAVIVPPPLAVNVVIAGAAAGEVDRAR